MINKFKNELKDLPALPGVYLMKDQEHTIIYVGKSKNLKRRVSSYFGESTHHSPKVKRMVRHIKSFDYVVTDTELDALLLECRLIKELRPIYNRLLKDDQKYRYIYISTESTLPRARVAYDKGDDGEYFGPYNITRQLEIAAEAINAYFKLPVCEGKMKKEGCLTFLRKQCLGPCEGDQKREIYNENIKRAIDFLRGNNHAIIDYYEEEMKRAAQNLDFEKASMYRDYGSVLKMLGFREEAIAFSLSNQKGIAFISRPEGGVKCYGLLGTQVIFTTYLERKQISSELLRNFNANKTSPRTQLSKEEVDEAHIMYSYIMSQADCEYEVLDEAKFKQI